MGSKRIKNKNLKKLGGKPIVLFYKTSYRIKNFDKIHVSTD